MVLPGDEARVQHAAYELIFVPLVNPKQTLLPGCSNGDEFDLVACGFARLNAVSYVLRIEKGTLLQRVTAGLNHSSPHRTHQACGIGLGLWRTQREVANRDVFTQPVGVDMKAASYCIQFAPDHSPDGSFSGAGLPANKHEHWPVPHCRPGDTV